MATAMASRVTQYVSVSGAVVYYYDFILTIDAERQLFWRIGGSWIVRIVFILTRYLPAIGLPLGLLRTNPFVGHLSDPTCRYITLGNAVCRVIVSISSTGMYCLRVYTLYRERRKVRRVLIAVFTGYVLFQVAMSCVAFHLLLPHVRSLYHGCDIISRRPFGTAHMVASTFLCALPCETLVIVLTVKHALKCRQMLVSEGNSAALPVLDRLYRDGVAYFVIAFLLRLWGCLVWFVCPWSLKFFSDSCNMALRSTVSSRFFLSLRKSIVASSRIAQHTTIAIDGLGGTIQLPPQRSMNGDSIRLSTIYRKQTEVDSPVGDNPSGLELCRTHSDPD